MDSANQPLDILTVSIAAYNDANSLADVVRESLQVAEELARSPKVLIINDGSSDATGTISDRLAADDPRIEVLHHARNLGFGPTLREVFLVPGPGWVCFLPADGQIPPSEMRNFIPHINASPFMLGLRHARQDGLLRHLNSTAYNVAISLLARKFVRDVNSIAFFRREAMQGIDLHSKSAFIHAEFFLKAASRSIPILEVPIAHKARAHGRGAGNRLPVIAATVGEFFRYALHWEPYGL